MREKTAQVRERFLVGLVLCKCRVISTGIQSIMALEFSLKGFLLLLWLFFLGLLLWVS